MIKITPTSPESHSADIVASNLSQLKALFPEAFTEGSEGKDAVNFEVLKQLLGGAVDEREEKYGLNWYGKRKARELALTPSTGTLRPCPEDSVDWDTTQNLMIEGDNLEVLKLLQKSYAGKVKLIYIDPPYNTGKDFVYPDNFQDNIKNYFELTGQIEGGRKMEANSDASGRFHTDWLNMMYPRLKLARNLLSEEGIVVIHIDEHEQSNLEILVNDIFGEENLLGVAVWDKKNPKGDSTKLAYQHESLFFIAKNQIELSCKGGISRRKKNAESILQKARKIFERIGNMDLPDDLKQCVKKYTLSGSNTEKYKKLIDLKQINLEFSSWIKSQDFSGGESAYSMIDDDGQVYRLVSMAWPNKKKAPDEYFIPLKHPITKMECPVPERGWRNPPGTMNELLDKGEIIFGDDHTTQPQRKYLLKNNLDENFPSVIGYAGSDDVLLANLGIPFENPKPVDLAREIIDSVAKTNGIILDFFAGSGTAAHAVMAQNSIDRGTRRFILVQLPEPLDPISKDQKIAANICAKLGKPLNIAELTKERLRRAGKKIAEELATKRKQSAATEPDLFNPQSQISNPKSPIPPDLGFRVFKLDSSNIRAWDPEPANLETALLDSVDHIKPGRTEADILYELLLKLGLDLAVPIVTRDFGSGIADFGLGRADFGLKKEENNPSISSNPKSPNPKSPNPKSQIKNPQFLVHAIGAGSLFVCLADKVKRDEVEALALGIVAWRKELNPVGEVSCVFRDSGFEDNVAKTNLSAILLQSGIGNVRSI